ncbi:MAG: hypothetical protein RR205_03890 [Oscillospiraceae bacterium]
MRINGFNVGQSNSHFNSARVNQSLTRNDNSILSAPKKDTPKSERRDTVEISPMGKIQNFLESLMKQKQQVLESKNELIGKTLNEGGTLESIQYRIDAYDEQLKNIDEQTSQVMKQQFEQQAEAATKKEEKPSEPKTEEEVKQAKLNSVTNLASDIDRLKLVSSVKAKVDGNAKVLKSEIELDGRLPNDAFSPTPAATISKESKLSQMKEKSLDLAKQGGEMLAETTAEIEQVVTVTPEKPSETDNATPKQETKPTEVKE